EAGARRVRPGLPVAGHARDHEPRVHGPELIGPEIPPLECPRPEVLDQDVALLGEREQELLTTFLAQIQRHAFLVPRLDGPPERPALVAGMTPLSKRVRLPRRLDLDDLGAHVAEQPAGERPGEQHAELDDTHAGKGPRPVDVRPTARLRADGLAHASSGTVTGS